MQAFGNSLEVIRIHLQVRTPPARSGARKQKVEAREESTTVAIRFSRLQQLLDLPDLAVCSELRWNEARVLQQAIGDAQVLRHEGVVIECHGQAHSRKIVELPALLGLPDTSFGDGIEGLHRFLPARLRSPCAHAAIILTRVIQPWAGGAMGLRLKFNIVLVVVFLLGLGVTGYVSHDLLHRNARDEVLRSAGVMMEAALSMRSYTVGQITPHLSYKLTQEFLPQSVPAYAATEIMNSLRKKYPDYWYKEATLNPTNPRDRAVEWEADLVSAFRNQPELKQLSGVRATPTGRSLYLTRPLAIRDPACLACHSVPSAAPVTLVKRYGDRNGFGWKLNEVVGAQVVSVPMDLPIRNANRAFLTFMTSLGAVFVTLFVILNVMMSALIVRPITRMSRAANQISTGDLGIPEFAESGKDEVALLAKSFNRMRRSLEKAIELIDRK